MLVQQEEVLVEWLKYIKGLWIERLHVGILVWEAVLLLLHFCLVCGWWALCEVGAGDDNSLCVRERETAERERERERERE